MFSYKSNIYLNTIVKVKVFVSIVIKYADVDVEVHQGKYVVDGKSIMGIFSINLCNELSVFFNSPNKESIESLLNELRYCEIEA